MEGKILRIRILLASIGLALSTPSMADVFELNNIDVPGARAIGNSFTTVGTKTDYYNVSIGQAADAGALIFELDLSSLLNIDITSISLAGGPSFAVLGSAGLFDFGIIAAGSYTMQIVANVTGINSLVRSSPLGFVSYGGVLGFTRAPVSSVPEPASLLLFGIGLLAIARHVKYRAGLPTHS